MKKFINEIKNIVTEEVEGMVLCHPNLLTRIPNTNVIIRKKCNPNKVALISGGGSGHEPAHAGYVGKGMLDGAVCGEVFTSPTPDQIYQAIKQINSKKGTLLIIKNYTGDILNFQMAQDMANAEKYNVDYVIVNDDIALENSEYTVGQRGIAGTIFVHKIAGAYAEENHSLSQVKMIAEKVIHNLASMGVALDACTVPANGKKSFELPEDMVEIGLGIHGEKGVSQEKIKNADYYAEFLLNKCLNSLKIQKKDKVAVLINGLGATPIMELYIVGRKVSQLLASKEIIQSTTLVGNYLTSLDMPGLSISILKLDDQLETLLNEKANTPAFKC